MVFYVNYVWLFVTNFFFMSVSDSKRSLTGFNFVRILTAVIFFAVSSICTVCLSILTVIKTKTIRSEEFIKQLFSICLFVIYSVSLFYLIDIILILAKVHSHPCVILPHHRRKYCPCNLPSQLSD